MKLNYEYFKDQILDNHNLSLFDKLLDILEYQLSSAKSYRYLPEHIRNTFTEDHIQDMTILGCTLSDIRPYDRDALLLYQDPANNFHPIINFQIDHNTKEIILGYPRPKDPIPNQFLTIKHITLTHLLHLDDNHDITNYNITMISYTDPITKPLTFRFIIDNNILLFTDLE